MTTTSLFHYLKKRVGLITMDERLDPQFFRVAATLDDYYTGSYLPLTDEQAEFARLNPSASAREVLALALDPPTIEEVRAGKLAEIDAYDGSAAVNSFTLGGERMWLDKATRVGLANSIAVEAAAGREVTTLWYGTRRLTLPIADARAALAALELYALECFNVTASHRAAVLALDSVDAIRAYDHTALYPQPLNLPAPPCAAE